MSSFSTRQTDAFGHWLLADSVADAVRRQRPDLAERVMFVEDRPSPLVQIIVSDEQCVVLARVAVEHRLFWVVATPDGEVTPVVTGGAEEIAVQMVRAYDRFAG